MKKKFILLFFFLQCIYIDNYKLENIRYPETPYHSAFSPAHSEINEIYFREWCNQFCETLSTIVKRIPEGYFLEIRGKIDATELPENREKISLARAESFRNILIQNGIPDHKLKAVGDLNLEEYLGKDKFDPENRVIRFRIQKMETLSED
ncbi:MAG TPA: hypothetical protein PK079_15170 [Leptospiraceae bacterium]|nr:hypothetical protein [Leptospiraceae bacterium]HMW07239.1 hypothetical protein [Leptospiraceae bacterium]HMX35478.1 hypothetical protein [Leptospiraceae bacterium]HMY32611.1 hypothetical protein [Leptospiraceae bacterium]HMZ63762.1 hypothetical protein [Leptospiraceae bacterium]